MRDFRKIQVWQKSHKLTLQLYKITSDLPKEELYGLTSQIRRASTSISANIAEGCGRDTQAELARFVHIASGSASELDYHLLLAHDLGFIDEGNYQELEKAISEIKRMLHGFEKTVSSNIKRV
ncbi:MAG: four helix bundle protein, partial [Anaerolineae bacterium]|nr:four helix bundle protein [Anaerolineae bacterium]